VPEAVAVIDAAELALVKRVFLRPAEVGVKVMVPVVQVLAALITKLAVQVPSVPENSASEELNGIAPNVIEPPLAVKVNVPQVPVVLMPWLAEQLKALGLTVRNALEMPVTLNVVPVPEVALTVTVSDLAPAVVGLKLIAPVVQEAPLAMVEPAVQVPGPTVKSVTSELLNGVAVRITGPPEALNVIEPVQLTLEPELIVGQAIVPLAAKAP
jgi:hypothetical protein